MCDEQLCRKNRKTDNSTIVVLKIVKVTRER